MTNLFKLLKKCVLCQYSNTNHHLNKQTKHQLQTDGINEKHLWPFHFLCAGHITLQKSFVLHTVNTQTHRYPNVQSMDVYFPLLSTQNAFLWPMYSAQELTIMMILQIKTYFIDPFGDMLLDSCTQMLVLVQTALPSEPPALRSGFMSTDSQHNRNAETTVDSFARSVLQNYKFRVKQKLCAKQSVWHTHMHQLQVLMV